MTYVLANLHYFLLMISAIVVCHELGHFVVAKLCGVQVSRFSIGFGPTLLSTTSGETSYQIGLLPLGGYVKMLGDLPDAEVPPALLGRAFSHKPVWQRTAIVLAGPLANLLLAFGVYLCMSVGSHDVADTRLGLVTPGEPAYQAGLRPGDRILAVDGVAVSLWEELREAIARRPDSPLSVTFERRSADGATQRRNVTLQARSRIEPNAFGEPESRGKVGVSIQYLLPIVAVVDPQSPAGRGGLRSGERILAVGDTPVAAWHEVRQALAAVPGSTVRLQVESVAPPAPPRWVELTAAAAPPTLDGSLFSAADMPAGYTGLVSQDSVVAEVEATGAAQAAGLQVGDRILALQIREAGGALQRRAVHVWEIDLATFGLSVDSDLSLEVQRGAEVLTLPLHLTSKTTQDALGGARIELAFGARNVDELLQTYVTPRQVGLLAGMQRAFWQVGDDAQLIGRGLLRMLRRSLPLSSMGGPIMLFVMAERSAKLGALYYFHTMAVISVNVGLINLLPIPVLDGGHLSFFALEAISGRPPSARLRAVAQTVGLVLLMGLMLFTLGHDAWRFIF